MGRWEIEDSSRFEKCLEGQSDQTWRCLGWGGAGRRCSRRTPNFQGLAVGWCHSQTFEIHEIELVWEEDGRFVSKHAGFEMPAR